MTLESNGHVLKVVGTRPIRPDGVEKVTGRANFGADRALPRMLYAKIKRSPHAHARIVRINAEKASALPGVRAVATSAHFPEIRPEEAFVGEGPMNFRDLSPYIDTLAAKSGETLRDRVLLDAAAAAAITMLWEG